MADDNAAAWIKSKQAHPFVVEAAPKHTSPKANQVIIKVHSVAINIIDALIQSTGMIVPEDAYPHILGYDVTGDVVAVGTEVTKIKAGDRVVSCGDNGTFQLFTPVSQELIAVLPDNVSYTQGAVLPLALSTSAVALFQKDTLALDVPKLNSPKNGKVVIIWGASSSVGSCGLQMVKAAGYEVAAVAGKRNEEYCKGLGADYVFDHQAPDVQDQITKALAGKPFAGVFCAVMAPPTITTCTKIAAQLGDKPSNKFVATVLAPMMKFEGEVAEGVTLGYCWGDSLRYNEVGPAVWDNWLSPALASGAMQCKPDPEVVGKGLESIQKGIDLLNKGVSAKKLVVDVI